MQQDIFTILATMTQELARQGWHPPVSMTLRWDDFQKLLGSRVDAKLTQRVADDGSFRLFGINISPEEKLSAEDTAFARVAQHHHHSRRALSDDAVEALRDGGYLKEGE